MKTELARLANRLYDHAPAAHRSMYSLYKSWSDRAERALLRRLISPGMTVFDIGANIGIYTTFLARLVGASGRVVAFEPEQRNVDRLRTAVRTYEQVEVVHAAVSDRSGILNLYVADDLNVDHRTYAPGEHRRKCVQVQAVALDDFVADYCPIDVVKMDIQGAELAALRGALQLLSSDSPPVLLLEYWPFGLTRAGDEPTELIRLLKSKDFEITTVDGNCAPELDSTQVDQYVNLVAQKKAIR